MKKGDTKELRESIYYAKKDLFDLRIKKASSGLSDTSQIKKKRRLIASLCTQINSIS
jgi:ribosomal protein L29